MIALDDRGICRWGVRESSLPTLLNFANGKLSPSDVERIVKEANRMIAGDVEPRRRVPILGVIDPWKAMEDWTASTGIRVLAADLRLVQYTDAKMARLRREMAEAGAPTRRWPPWYRAVLLDYPVRWWVAWNGTCPPAVASVAD